MCDHERRKCIYACGGYVLREEAGASSLRSRCSNNSPALDGTREDSVRRRLSQIRPAAFG